jgi:hypothetical protein
VLFTASQCVRNRSANLTTLVHSGGTSERRRPEERTALQRLPNWSTSDVGYQGEKHISPSINGPSVVRFAVCGRWSPVTSAYQFSAIYGLTVIPVAGGPSIVFAGTAGAGVWKSVDGGATWEATGLSDRMCLSLSTDSSSVLYAGTDEEAHVSRDLGETWSNIDHRLGGADAFGYAVVVDPAGHGPGNAPTSFERTGPRPLEHERKAG